VAFPPAVCELQETTNVVAVPGAVGFGVTEVLGLLSVADLLSRVLASAAGAALASAVMVRPAVTATDLTRRMIPPFRNAPASLRIPGGRTGKPRSFA
jgi:hypothetical protein